MLEIVDVLEGSAALTILASGNRDLDHVNTS